MIRMESGDSLIMSLPNICKAYFITPSSIPIDTVLTEKSKQKKVNI